MIGSGSKATRHRASVTLADTQEGWSGGACYDNCMGASSPIVACTCVCGGTNHGSGVAVSGTSVPTVTDDDLPTPTKDQQVLMGLAEGDEQEARERLEEWFMDTFPGGEGGELEFEEEDAIGAYSSGANNDINKALRETNPSRQAQKMKTPPSGADESIQDITETVSNIVSKGEIPQQTTVYRGVPSSIVDNLQAGDVLHDAGFWSTSVNPQLAKGFAGSGGAVMEINVPKGTGYASGVWGGHPEEMEIILGTGSQVRIAGVEHTRSDDGSAQIPYLKAVLETK